MVNAMEQCGKCCGIIWECCGIIWEMLWKNVGNAMEQCENDVDIAGILLDDVGYYFLILVLHLWLKKRRRKTNQVSL